MKVLRGKVAVVTGAASGIGRALAHVLAAEGCNLALVDINVNALHGLASTLVCPGLVTIHQADVTDHDRMAALPAEVHAHHGAIHLLFNNAGITINKSFESSSMDDLRLVIDVNLWGVLYGCHYFLPWLKQQPEAHIVNTASMAALLGLPNQASYCLSKAAVRSLSESLRAELAVHGIGVTAIYPGTINTNILNAAATRSGENRQATEKLAQLMNRYGMSPDKLAIKTIKAVKRNQLQLRIGFDAYLADWLKRLLPTLIHRPLQWGFKRTHQRAAQTKSTTAASRL